MGVEGVFEEGFAVLLGIVDCEELSLGEEFGF